MQLRPILANMFVKRKLIARENIYSSYPFVFPVSVLKCFENDVFNFILMVHFAKRQKTAKISLELVDELERHLYSFSQC